MRSIDADALVLEVIRNLMPNVDIDGTVRVEDAERYFLNLIEKAPTCGGKQGNWIKPSVSSQECCSQCGRSPKMLFGLLPEYCPHCGSRNKAGCYKLGNKTEQEML